MLFLAALVHECGNACLVSSSHGLGLFLHLIHLILHVVQLLKSKTVLVTKRPVALAQLKQGTHAGTDLIAVFLGFGSPVGWIDRLRRRSHRVWRLYVCIATCSIRKGIVEIGARSRLAWVLMVDAGL